jgi:hypothetical protein
MMSKQFWKSLLWAAPLCALFWIFVWWGVAGAETPIFTFVQITDIHVDATHTFGLSQVVSDINNGVNFPVPNFVVITGDLTNNGTEAELSQIKTILDNLTIPYYPIVAGHDTNGDTGTKGTNWLTVFGENRFSYSWTVANYLFIALDETAPAGGYGTTRNSAEHQTFVTNTLSADSTSTKVMVFTHQNFVEFRDQPAGSPPENYYIAPGTLGTILSNDGRFNALFCGHAHLNATKVSNGVLYQNTKSFSNRGEYRYVEVYSDRIVTRLYQTPTHATDYDELWGGETDSTHTAANYSVGLPKERNFIYYFSSGGITTTYYIDNSLTDTNVASATLDSMAYNPSTFSSTTGTDPAYSTLADLNAFSPGAGDTVLLRKDKTWREQLTVPASGGAGNPIIYSSFGSGNGPIITGLDILTGFVDSSSLQVTDNFASDANPLGGNWVTVTNLANMKSASGVALASGNVAKSGAYWNDTFSDNQYSQAKITDESITNVASLLVRASPTQETYYELSVYATYLSCYYVINGGTKTKIGSNITNTYAQNNVYRIEVTGQDTDAVITFYVNGSSVGTFSGVNGINSGKPGIKTYYQTQHFDDFAGGNLGSTWTVSKKTGVTVEPKQVYYNGTALTLDNNTSPSLNKWYWASNILYINTGGDPSGGTVEAGQRDYGITSNGKDYLIFKKLQIQGANISNVYLDGAHQSELDYSISTKGIAGVKIANANAKVQNSVIYGNSTGGVISSAGSIVNSILYGNTAMLDESEATADITYSDLQTSHTGTGNITTNPLFVSTSTPDFHLMPRSPAIDAGTNVSLTSDYSGALAPQRSTPSIGAYEYIRKRVGNRIMAGVTGALAQTVSLTTPSAMAVGDTDQALTYSATSGLTVALTTNDSGICTITGSGASQKLHAVGSGTCVVYGNQAGNNGYWPATQVTSGNVTISAGSACDPATNEIGDRTQEASAMDIPPGYAIIYRSQADCSGTLESAYWYHGDTNNTAAKVCIYSSSAATPQSGDAKIGCSAEFSPGTTTGWKTVSIGSGSVTSGSYYWVVVMVNSTGANYNTPYTTTQSCYFSDISGGFGTGSYASPPSTFGATSFTESPNTGPLSVYVRLQ